jgi:hypothetical protein
MLTLEEYKAASRPAVRRQGIRIGVLLVFFLILLAATFTLGLRFKHNDDYAIWFVNNVGGHYTAFFLLFGVCVLILAFLGAIMGWMGRVDRRDVRLYCPHCRQRLNRGVEYAGLCASCGERALTMPGDPAQPAVNPAPPGLLTVEEFQKAVAANMRRDFDQIGVLFLPLFLFLASVGGAFAGWKEPMLRWLSGQVQADISEDVFWIVAGAVAFAIFLGTLGVLLFRERNALRDPHCPNCRQHLMQCRVWVVATRRCPRCATVVLTDPDSSANISDVQPLVEQEGVDHFNNPPIALEDFRADLRSYRRWIVVL